MMKSLSLFTFLFLVVGLCGLPSLSTASAQSLTITSRPTIITAGQNYWPKATYQLSTPGILQVQLLDVNWNVVTQKWINVPAGSANRQVRITVPANTAAGNNYRWQFLLYDRDWDKKIERRKNNIRVINNNGSSGGVLPPGNWTMEWNDEFAGSGAPDPDKWFPFLGWTPTDFANKTYKGLHYTGGGENTSQMYSTKTGNHWLANGKLVMRIISDKNDTNVHGPKVKGAYLLSGYPKQWDSTEPTNVKWGGNFFDPGNGTLFVSTRVKTNQVKGHATWFAFWLMTQTRPYDGDWANGTEVDIIEIPRGDKNWMRNIFTVANHWYDAGQGGSRSNQFNTGSSPTADSIVDTNDNAYHVYGVEWNAAYLKYYIDGQHIYTITDGIPTDPVDMMVQLTFEYKRNWGFGGTPGDGRYNGPFVSDNASMREMSRAYVDYVRVYRKN